MKVKLLALVSQTLAKLQRYQAKKVTFSERYCVQNNVISSHKLVVTTK